MHVGTNFCFVGASISETQWVFEADLAAAYKYVIRKMNVNLLIHHMDYWNLPQKTVIAHEKSNVWKFLSFPFSFTGSFSMKNKNIKDVKYWRKSNFDYSYHLLARLSKVIL